MIRLMIVLSAGVLLASCGSKTGGTGGSSSDIHVVGSSTVYPFTKAVAEDFMRANPGINATVESTGTGGGMKLFCAGVGGQSPDIEDASRADQEKRIRCLRQERREDDHRSAGRNRRSDDHRSQQCAGDEPHPGRHLQGACSQSVREGSQQRPDVEGRESVASGNQDPRPRPTPTSGTRDSLADLYLTKGCDTDPAMAALAKSNEDQHKQICTKIREDGAYVEAGENDNLLVQKVGGRAGDAWRPRLFLSRTECRQDPPGEGRRRRSDRRDDRQP